MGAEFIKECTPSFTKGFDKSRKDLKTADLFTDLRVDQKRTYRARPTDGSAFQEGETLLVRTEAQETMLIRIRKRIGNFCNLPPSTTEKITNQGHGYATATVVKVHELSGSADIRID